MKQVAQPDRIDRMIGIYKCPELKSYPNRPGAMDAYKLPSRIGTNLNYPDGKQEKLK